jgi:adenosine deaminase
MRKINTQWVVVGLCAAMFGCNGTTSVNTIINQTVNQTTAEVRETVVTQKMNALRYDSAALKKFLKDMPKGADLHSHLSGAVSTEKLIEWGAADGACIDTITWIAALPPCKTTQVTISNALSDQTLYKNILKAWSMDSFQGTLLEAHQHFFDAFGKFSAVQLDSRTDDSIADVLSIAGKNNQIYIELMQGLGASTVGALAAKYFQPTDAWTEAVLLEKRQQIIADPLFKQTLDKNAANLKSWIEGARKLLNCGNINPDEGCNVDVRFLVSANRTKDRASVFAQWVYGYEFTQLSPLVVGVELVSPEEDANSLKYYTDEMFALDVLRRFNQADTTRRPVRISLHAGELIPEVLPNTPEGQAHLKYHIRQAVEIAHAERIGHAVDILQEDQPLDLMKTMREKNVMAEICLTSNMTLLGKEGSAHPVNNYLENQVPAALATDDEGILRGDITDEYVRAVTKQGLDYPTLKKMVRTSLEHSFLTGSSLWKTSNQFNQFVDACANDDTSNSQPSDLCKDFLSKNERAAMQWKLETQLTTFEKAQF